MKCSRKKSVIKMYINNEISKNRLVASFPLTSFTNFNRPAESYRSFEKKTEKKTNGFLWCSDTKPYPYLSSEHQMPAWHSFYSMSTFRIRRDLYIKPKPKVHAIVSNWCIHPHIIRAQKLQNNAIDKYKYSY